MQNSNQSGFLSDYWNHPPDSDEFWDGLGQECYDTYSPEGIPVEDIICNSPNMRTRCSQGWPHEVCELVPSTAGKRLLEPGQPVIDLPGDFTFDPAKNTKAPADFNPYANIPAPKQQPTTAAPTNSNQGLQLGGLNLPTWALVLAGVAAIGGGAWYILK
ncbi:MAG: hypothetical protein LAT67_05065 [Balneolales bacterium]|nr:hypothetical protein [Balneolales bacterium]